MALERTFAELNRRLKALQDALDALSTTVEEDRPKRRDVVVAQSLGDAVLAARGLVEESRSAANEATQAVVQRSDGDRMQRALASCQEKFHRFLTQFASELISYERIDDLVNIARERGREWSHWVDVVRQELEQCRLLAEDVRDCLLLCWQELVERAGTTSVSVQNTTIGQQIAAPELMAKEAVREGIT